jgi:serine/threonine protein kinase
MPQGSPQPPLQQKPQQQAPRPKPKLSKGDEVYINTVLNNRFKVESKIGEGGFGAVYRGIQLATGRKVALKLLHPEMTKDENLVARFRREGMVLCNLRDAHTITTYDFDQTNDGTLYIAMELLEGKSLHQIFHEQAPLEWKRVFKIVSEMCSSLAEAHAQGIVHRDLKPENVYLETRPGNPEFVKILDFGIAKVMRGDSIDPQSPQLTATGQTLGTLEYMSPEQLMGKALDGRSDVYALGVVSYEMMTGRLPFPDAKGPAGLITAQLKQTPIPPSQANPKANIPPGTDRVILKCLEKDKNNRYADVTALSVAIQDLLAHETPSMSGNMNQSSGSHRLDMMETRRGPGDMSSSGPPAMPSPSSPPPGMVQQMAHHAPSGPTPPPPYYHPTPPSGSPFVPQAHPSPVPAPPVVYPGGISISGSPPPMAMSAYPSYPTLPRSRGGSSKWIWWVLALLALGAGAGAALAFLMR